MFNSSTQANNNICYSRVIDCVFFNYWQFGLVWIPMGVCFQYVVLLVLMRVRNAWYFIQFYSRFSIFIIYINISTHTYQLQCLKWIEFFYFASETANTLDFYRSAIFSHHNQFAPKIYKIGSVTLNPIWIFGLELC